MINQTKTLIPSKANHFLLRPEKLITLGFPELLGFVELLALISQETCNL